MRNLCNRSSRRRRRSIDCPLQWTVDLCRECTVLTCPLSTVYTSQVQSHITADPIVSEASELERSTILQFLGECVSPPAMAISCPEVRLMQSRSVEKKSAAEKNVLGLKGLLRWESWRAEGWPPYLESGGPHLYHHLHYQINPKQQIFLSTPLLLLYHSARAFFPPLFFVFFLCIPFSL